MTCGEHIRMSAMRDHAQSCEGRAASPGRNSPVVISDPPSPEKDTGVNVGASCSHNSDSPVIVLSNSDSQKDSSIDSLLQWNQARMPIFVFLTFLTITSYMSNISNI